MDEDSRSAFYVGLIEGKYGRLPPVGGTARSPTAEPQSALRLVADALRPTGAGERR